MRWPTLPAALLAALALPLFSQQLDVKTHTLSNGLKILIHEDHDIPNVALYLFFKIGSRNERPGITGISHYFEHMMFNGAKKYGPKQFDIEMEKAGGNNNAYTTRDVTVYTDWFPRAAMELMFDMESDRMQHLAFDPKIVESERGVVYSERRLSVDNNNFGLLYEQVNAAAFTAHPYSWPVIGWASDIEAWTMDDLKHHYRIGYAPNNCVMVVTGAVTEKEVMALAKKYLEPIPAQEPPPPVRTVEPEQRGERRVTVRKFAQLPVQLIAYHVPATRHEDWNALEMLVNILSQGRSSRLYRRLVDQDQLAMSVNASVSPSLDPGLLTISMSPRAGVDPSATEKALYEELERIQSEGVNQQELEKARNQITADFFRGMTTIAGKANALGTYEIFYGDYKRLLNIPQEIAQVTREQIQSVARKYLAETNRTVGTLIPEKAPAKEATE
jgi:zinc protease